MSAVALVLFVALVAYVAITKPDIQQATAEEPHAATPRATIEPAVEGAT